MIPVDSGPGTVTVTPNGLGLQGKAKGGDDLNEYINRPADPRLNSIISKLGLSLKQGIIQQMDEWVVSPQQHPYACRFMFNPTTLNVSYTAGDSAIPPGRQTPDQLAAVALGPGLTSLSFGLFFDRTYEVAYGPTHTNPLRMRDIGVYHDIAALELVTGARNNFAATPDAVISQMALVPCYFIFGGGRNNAGLSFIGTITNMTVQYTSFSVNMVPIRAAVTLEVTQSLGKDFGEYSTKGGSLLNRAQDRSRRKVEGHRNLPKFPPGHSAARERNEHQSRRPAQPSVEATNEGQARRPGNLPTQ